MVRIPRPGQPQHVSVRQQPRSEILSDIDQFYRNRLREAGGGPFFARLFHCTPDSARPV